ncbi:hypothetical protein C518_1366 [Lysinibacillus fusiformis ZB2]|uniref:hypothetical protein n=1 Tax=Lysinibacillus capsici TaxID=2115968 RepID=UPI00029C886E|nr:hypothetical protein [Lysinibacillus capsici]EKU43484.1 hypothetical protein C518_1366 [Lysinibacillus fusiformis ZB2]
MKKAQGLKCLALFLFTTIFLYGVGETYEVSWLQFNFTGQYQDVGFYFSFTSLIPILIGLLMVGLYESLLKRFI